MHREGLFHMIDFVKIKYRDKSVLETIALKKSQELSLKQEVDFTTGDLVFPIKGEKWNFQIKIHEKSGFVEGSIHKLSNVLKSGESHNYNRFTKSELETSLKELNDVFPGIVDEGVTQLEIGFNYKTSKKATEIVLDNLYIYLRDNPKFGYDHDLRRRYQGKGVMKKFDRSQYEIKVYDKGVQYDFSEFLLRVELKMTSRVLINKVGVFKVGDLLDERVLENCFNEYRERLKSLVLVDDYKRAKRPPINGSSLEEVLTSRYWTDQRKSSRTTFKRKKDAFYEYLFDQGLLNLLQGLQKSTQDQFDEFING